MPRRKATQRRGRAKAQSVCGVCHGVDGLTKIPEAPNLAGQNESYLIEQMGAFKSGERKNEMMSVVVQDLSETDIENLAAYYSGIRFRSRRRSIDIEGGGGGGGGGGGKKRGGGGGGGKKGGGPRLSAQAENRRVTSMVSP